MSDKKEEPLGKPMQDMVASLHSHIEASGVAEKVANLMQNTPEEASTPEGKKAVLWAQQLSSIFPPKVSIKAKYATFRINKLPNNSHETISLDDSDLEHRWVIEVYTKEHDDFGDFLTIELEGATPSSIVQAIQERLDRNIQANKEMA